MKKMIFETERLMTRTQTMGDYSDLVLMQGDSEVMRFITGVAMSEEETLKKLQRDLKQYQEKDPWITVMAVILKETGDFIGTIALYKEENSEWQIGYRFLPAYWGKGYGEEVLSGFLHHLSKHSELKKVYGTVDKQNTASVRVMEKAGMKYIREYFLEEEGTWEAEYQFIFDSGSQETTPSSPVPPAQ